jgi:hypothetical protein
MKNLYLALIILLSLSCKHGTPKDKFEKIIFHSSTCFGTCGVYHLEVDSDKTIKLFAETVYLKSDSISYELDTTRMGRFIGKLSDSVFLKLINEMERIDVDTIQFDDIQCCDAPIKTIIAYYNGKRNFQKSMLPQEKADQLIDLLYQLCDGKNLIKTKHSFKIEEEEKLR